MTTPRSGLPNDLSSPEGKDDQSGTSTSMEHTDLESNGSPSAGELSISPEAADKTTDAGSDQAQSLEELSFWPPVRRHIMGLEPAERPIKVTCGMCSNEVSIAGLPAPVMNNDEVRKGCVYPCGHIFCKDCDDSMMQHEYETCPVCRLQLHCETCGLRPDPRTAPTAGESTEKVKNIPETIPEGGFYEPRCVMCLFGHPDSRRNLWMRGAEPTNRSEEEQEQLVGGQLEEEAELVFPQLAFLAQTSFEPVGGCTCELCTYYASQV
ncbi:hypothetical protein EDB80DRAFT_778593 [Ilyonectria destructans]|nr:hypothetical protein EDB80DRAFT_778593 [Ilyonectria destructans]